ncbi:MAG: hypothetical protein V4673_15965 [Pseudomonadota bacterium]
MKTRTLILTAAMVCGTGAATSAGAADGTWVQGPSAPAMNMEREAEQYGKWKERPSPIELAPAGLQPTLQGKPANFQLKYNFQACAGTLTSCAVASYGSKLFCAAIALGTAAPEVLPVMIPACATMLLAAGGACGSAVYYCTGGGGNSPTLPPTRRLATVGDWTGDGAGPDDWAEVSCPGGSLMNGVRVFENGSRVTGLTLNCLPTTANGAYTLKFIGYTANGTWQGCANSGELVAGFNIRSGSEIDALGVVCRKFSDGTKYGKSLLGGSGGVRNDRHCPAGQELHGVKVQHDGASETNRNILGIEVICR